MSTFDDECQHWHHRNLIGKYAHMCPDWDGLPLDETCGEFESCHCYDDDPDAIMIRTELRRVLDSELCELERDAQMHFLFDELDDEEGF